MLFTPLGPIEAPNGSVPTPLFESLEAWYGLIMADPVADSGRTLQLGDIRPDGDGKPIPVAVAGNPDSPARVLLVSSGGRSTDDDAKYAADLAVARRDTAVFLVRFEHGDPEFASRLATTVLDDEAHVFLLPRVGETAKAQLVRAFDKNAGAYDMISNPLNVEPAAVARAIQAAMVGLPEQPGWDGTTIIRSSGTPPRPGTRRRPSPRPRRPSTAR